MNSPSHAQILRIKVRNPWTYIRVIAIALFSIWLADTVPYAGAEMATFLHTNSLVIGIIYAIIVGFIMSIALQRNQELLEYISVEINKLRHLYHLSKYIAETDRAFAPWMKEMSLCMRDYLIAFEGKRLKNYAQSNGLFRKLTQTIYRLPQVQAGYPAEMYHHLMDTTTAIAEARQHIREKVNFRIGAFQWSTLITVTLTFSVFVLLGAEQDLFHRGLMGLLVFNVLLVLDLLYEYDGFRSAEMAFIAHYYQKDLKDLGLDDKSFAKKRKKRA